MSLSVLFHYRPPNPILVSEVLPDIDGFIYRFHTITFECQPIGNIPTTHWRMPPGGVPPSGAPPGGAPPGQFSIWSSAELLPINARYFNIGGTLVFVFFIDIIFVKNLIV